MKVNDVYSYLNQIYDFSIQESFDNSGKQIIFSSDQVENIMISVDLDYRVIEKAIDSNCNVIILHHPLIFKKLDSLCDDNKKDNLIFRLIEKRISIIAVHTNLDKKYPLLLGDIIGLQNQQVLVQERNDKWSGFGSIGSLESRIKFSKLLEIVRTNLDVEFLLYSGDENITVQYPAVINGSGTSFFKVALEQGADCIITGDVGYHAAKDAEIYELPIIDAGHFATEKMFKKIIKKDLQNSDEIKQSNINIILNDNELNPIKLYTGAGGE